LPFMKRAAVLAMSSIFEALPTVLIEALAVSTPIVAADCQVGPREILCDGKYGSLVPVGDTAGLAQALIRVLRSQNRPVVPKEALERFQHDCVIDQYLKLMDVTASKSSAAAHF
jgi:glycosyltransferase involved in cell wall biosynthesis